MDSKLPDRADKSPDTDSMAHFSEGAAPERVYSSVRESVLCARKAVVKSVNNAIVLAYWDVGRQIFEAVGSQAEYGKALLKFLSVRLTKEFGSGFSVPNLRKMRQFYLMYQKRSTLSSELSWSHYCLLMRLSGEKEREFYTVQAVKEGWSVRQLEHYIDINLFGLRQGRIVSNFASVFAEEDEAEAVSSVFKEPYVFDFLSLGKVFDERKLEDALVDDIIKTLMEFGNGFAFVGRQVRLVVGGDEFFIDLLFYHLQLHRYVVVELKSGKFLPEYAGKMNFYLSAVDDLIKTPLDSPSIGLILCQEKRGIVAEYALRDLHKPVGVAKYVLASELPEELKRILPGGDIFGDGVVREMEVVYRRKKEAGGS
ncbi:MAG TPA: PDDEXK nuclease domain-containing protein [Methanocorpusculum sp.]|nr:PDDEXK nuclease domain-containing protein [Methanocorpusculum sp.]